MNFEPELDPLGPEDLAASGDPDARTTVMTDLPAPDSMGFHAVGPCLAIILEYEGPIRVVAYPGTAETVARLRCSSAIANRLLEVLEEEEDGLVAGAMWGNALYESFKWRSMAAELANS